jgi:hypothetical protein
MPQRGSVKHKRRDRNWRHTLLRCDAMCDRHSGRRDRLKSRAVSKRAWQTEEAA